jgi:hypothetical protein
MRLGLADHLGWAVAVCATDDHVVADRRRIELVEPGLTAAPIHYDRGRLALESMVALIARVRASISNQGSAAFDELATSLPEPIVSISLRTWPDDFPEDIEAQRLPPYEARADAIMYRQVLADVARDRGWTVHEYDAKRVVAEATRILGRPCDPILDAPRATLGPPWTKDHRTALAATIVASG